MNNGEYVLSFPRRILDEIGSFQGLNFDIELYLNRILSVENARFRHRNTIENDPSIKQIIPYVIFEHNGKILFYQRGKKACEGRLRHLGSIGIGGHISLDDDSYSLFNSSDLFDAYSLAVKREVQEELKINTEYKDTKVALINDDSNDVGKVHFGIVHIWNLDTPSINKKEQQITKLTFCEPDFILKTKRDVLENWSKICINEISKILQKNIVYNCLFCNTPHNFIILENDFAYMIRDQYPVTTLHSLIIPKRHVQSYFELDNSEILACYELLEKTKDDILSKDFNVKGFNIGINDGHAGGQTIPHCHIHLIPRRDGDVKNPRGGIRHIIPNKGFY